VDRKSFLKKAYRLILDSLEEISMLFANLVLVNSQFTRDIVKQAFPLYSKYGR
jgi:alpha-1,3/alpha-1,6-mannosyltransferase